MADELIDIFDEKNKPLDIQKMKSEAHRKGLWHRTAHIWIYNSKGEMLVQLRAKDKDLYPNMWDISVAGHIGAGEEPIISALREIREEIGLSINSEELKLFKIRKSKKIYKEIIDNDLPYVYFFKFDGDIEGLSLQKEEVAEIKFVPIEKIEEDLKENPDKYCPHGNYWNEVIDEVKKLT